MARNFSIYHFQGQHDGEQVLEVIHRHWFNILMHFLGILLLVLALFGSFFILTLLSPDFTAGSNGRFLLFLQNTFLILVWIYGFFIWIDYYFDVWIITNERIVNIEQKGLFMRQVSELKFDKVQDVTSEVKGFIPTLLNFGDVFIQTAGETERFRFRQVPDSYKIKDMIMRLASGASHDKLQAIAKVIQDTTKL